MDENQAPPKTLTLVMGAAFVGTGIITIFMQLSLTGSVLLIMLGVVSVTAVLMGFFEEGRGPRS